MTYSRRIVVSWYKYTTVSVDRNSERLPGSLETPDLFRDIEPTEGKGVKGTKQRCIDLSIINTNERLLRLCAVGDDRRRRS
ncbi:hypothetical protein ES702_00600 [subsurface metagenome]